MPGKQGNPKADAVKMAALAIVWGAVAGVAYLGLISKAIDLRSPSPSWRRLHWVWWPGCGLRWSRLTGC